MKLFATLFLALALSACKSSAPVVETPVPAFRDGTEFGMPCQEHGIHMHKITAHTLGIVYTIVNDAGETAQVPEELLKQVLDSLDVSVQQKRKCGP